MKRGVRFCWSYFRTCHIALKFAQVVFSSCAVLILDSAYIIAVGFSYGAAGSDIQGWLPGLVARSARSKRSADNTVPDGTREFFSLCDTKKKKKKKHQGYLGGLVYYHTITK